MRARQPTQAPYQREGSGLGAFLRGLGRPAPRPLLALDDALPYLFPKVRPALAYAAYARRTGRAPAAFRPLAGAYAVSLVLDLPNQDLDLELAHLRTWGVDFDGLLQRARTNLLGRGGEQRFQELREGCFRSTWRDSLDGSRMLLPGMLRRLGLRGDPVVLLPSRDMLLVLGDRFEMHSAVVAALPLKIPVAHIHGGELSEGAIDDALRHSITKMSHLHFVATETYRNRVIQMGEEPWRVVISGAPALDNLKTIELPTRAQLSKGYGLREEESFLLVTYHPVTLEHEQTEAQMTALLQALGELDMAVVFTYPNADTGNRAIIQLIGEYVASNSRARTFVNLGTRGYFSMMKHATAMVGNSSSGIIEAASFKLPVVNIGNRQRGRLRAANVIDVGYSRREIAAGIRQALAPDFRARLDDLVNPYGDGHAAERIVETLRAVELNDKLLLKHFHGI